MKTSILFLLFTFSLQGLCMDVLVTYFDPFGGKEINNSEVVALKLQTTFNDNNITLKFCKLTTAFDKAYAEIEDCVASLETRPSMIISIGEAGCYGVKIETRAINYDRSTAPDNDGVDRYGTPIYPGEEKSLGVTLPVQKGYCSLSDSQKKRVFISQNAGSFVCNNTLYHVLRNLEIPATFVHVSTKKCTKGEEDIVEMAGVIGTMISNMSGHLSEQRTSQPASKEEVKKLLKTELNNCEEGFYKILKNEY